MGILPADFFLTSSEGYGLELTRRCRSLGRIGAPNREDYLLVQVSPPLDGIHFGRPGISEDRLLLASHNRGTSLFPVSNWPLQVYVLRALVSPVDNRHALGNDEVELVGWAEIHASTDTLPEG